MKRSEMVEILYRHLIFFGEPRNKFYKTVDSPLKKELADILLEQLEKAGMLPPLIEDNGTVGLTGKEAVQLQGNEKVKISVWEPEDE